MIAPGLGEALDSLAPIGQEAQPAADRRAREAAER
jgi:hypothetical protein